MLYQISPDALLPQVPDKDDDSKKPSTTSIVSVVKSSMSIAIPALAADVALTQAKKHIGPETHIIQTEEELAQYTHAFNADWIPMQFYLRHPFKEKLLIPQDDFKTYIAREIASEIIDYIGEHMALKEIAVCLISSKGGKGEIKVPIKKVIAKSSLKLSVNQKYLLHSYNRKRTLSSHQYYWIQSFPDIISLVSGESGKAEIISECASNFTSGIDLQNIQTAFGKEKALSFYIYYEKED